jgi:predicted NBD/HSP70 family sugar kinase
MSRAFCLIHHTYCSFPAEVNTIYAYPGAASAGLQQKAKSAIAFIGLGQGEDGGGVVKGRDAPGRKAGSGAARRSSRRPGASTPAKPRRVEATRQSLAGILSLVLTGEASTRHEVELRTGLGRAIVVDRLATLNDLGLIDESERGPASGGRAPRLLRFRAGVGLILVAGLDKSTLSVGVADLSGRLLVEHHEAIDLISGPELVLRRLSTLFDWVLEQHQGDRAVWGIGIALPGPVEPTAGEPFASPVFHFMPTWRNYPLVEQLVARHRAPVWVRSSVETMALGEQKAGFGQGAASLLFLKLGRSISAGLIADGRLVRGALGGGGLIGHIVADETSREPCPCGNVGCLEVLAGGDAIAREGQAAARSGRSQQLQDAMSSTGTVTANDVGTAAQLGDPFSAELVGRCGRLLGNALASATNLFNPAIIVLGGDAAQMGDLLLSAVRQAIYRRAHPVTTRDLRIVTSRMGRSGGLLGAALVVVDTLFTGTGLESWVPFGSPLQHPEFAARVAEAERAVAGQEARPAPPPDHALVGRVKG